MRELICETCGKEPQGPRFTTDPCGAGVFCDDACADAFVPTRKYSSYRFLFIDYTDIRTRQFNVLKETANGQQN